MSATATKRTTRTFSLDPEIIRAVEKTKGKSSASERVNALLRFALELERRAELHQEAASFYAAQHGKDDREQTRAFQDAAISSVFRD
jgi:hypothetical protein